MSESSPAFRFYTGDFLADSHVSSMDFAERGLYITLLAHAWREGSIPSQLDEIARLAQGRLAVVKKLWPRVSQCFQPQADGRLIQPRLEEEREKQRAYQQSKAKAGKKGAEARWYSDDRLGTEPSLKNGTAIRSPLADDSVGLAITNDGGSFSSSFSSSIPSSPNGDDPPAADEPKKSERKLRNAKPLPEIPPEFADDVGRLIANDAKERKDGKISDTTVETNMLKLRRAFEIKGIYALRTGIDVAISRGKGLRYAAGCVRNASSEEPAEPLPMRGTYANGRASKELDYEIPESIDPETQDLALILTQRQA